MGEKNTVNVIIYGQEYTISGEMPRDYILKIADHLDSKMKEVGEGSSEPYSKIAVLAGMLVADEYFKSHEKADTLSVRNVTLEQTSDKYEKLWGEVKLNFAQYKEEMKSVSAVKDKLQALADEKDAEAKSLAQDLAQEQKFNQELRNRMEELLAKEKTNQGLSPEVQKHIEELENKCRDIESSFFDIQMENIHLKNEIETLRGSRR